MKSESFSVAAAPKGRLSALASLSEVRWGLIGVGIRGLCHLETLLMLEGARVTAVCDGNPERLRDADELVRKARQESPICLESGEGDDNWRQLLELDNVDAVVISSPWPLHAKMAIAAMDAGKNAFVEVPAALTLEECWQLVDTAESTGLYCMMLENCNYGREELMLLNLVRQGLLGELLHAEAAYIHELRPRMLGEFSSRGAWRTQHLANAPGNLYPTHGIGPLAHCMDVNRGDYFESIVSMSSPARGRALFAEEHLPEGHRWREIKEWASGDINTSIIKLVSGKTMMVQWDETSPRPYTRHNLLQGTRGTYGSFPARIALDYPLEALPEAVRATVPQKDGRTDFHVWDMNITPWFEAYDHPVWKKLGLFAEEHGGHDGMDYMMFWRIQQRMMAGLPMDQSVYDAALWSSVGPLSGDSVRAGGAPQQFPDFTRGGWRTAKPVEIEI